MGRIIPSALLALALLALPYQARAEQVVSAYLGASMPHEADVTRNTPAGGTGTMEFDPGVGFGLKGGYWYTDYNAPFIGFQLDLNARYPDGDALTPNGGAAAVMDADFSVYSFSINGLVRWPEGMVRPYGGAGIGWFYGELGSGTLSSSVLGVPTSFRGDEDSAFGWQVLAGVDFIVMPKMSVFVEYKYARADFEFARDVHLDVEYGASQAYGGVSYRY